MTTRFIVNPRSAGGATGSRVAHLEARIRAVFGESAEVVFTERQGHAIELAAACEGLDMVVSVGGDGTANEVVNGLSRINADRPAMGVLPAGTGSDLVRSIGMPHDVDDALGVLRDGERRQVDWIRVRHDRGERICMNVAGFGMAGAIVAAVNQGSKRFGGKATFAAATARVALRWKPPRVAVTWEGPEGEGRWEGPLASTFVANGHYCGGGMWVGAGGSMSDGVVEMTIIPDQPMLKTIRHSPRLYTGTMRDAPGVVFSRIRTLKAESLDGDVPVDVDGENPGSLPVEMLVEPGVLSIVGRWVTLA